MVKGIIARKIGMSQIFSEEGLSIPVTVLRAGPCEVLQVKTVENDGYASVQIGFEAVKSDKLNSAARGHQKGIERPYRMLREFPVSDGLEKGSILGASSFEEGQKVKVTGFTKGKGFAGVVKRYGFGGGRKTHGSGFHRTTGSLNATTTPGRVFKGKSMPGHMGNRKVAVLNLEIVKVDAGENLIFLKGAVPGPRSGYVTIEAR